MERGFSLIELLVVIAVIGILAGIAIPQFSEYRARAFDARVVSDLRNAAVGEEAYFVSHEAFLPCTNAGCEDPNLPGYFRSQDTLIEMTVAGITLGGTAEHPSGTGLFTYDGTTGRITRP